MTPWEKLNAAADRLELLAEQVTDISIGTRTKYDGVNSLALTMWRGEVGPHTAGPLVSWLRLAAEDYESRKNFPKLGEPNPRSAPVSVVGAFGPCWQTLALDFAELILGGAA